MKAMRTILLSAALAGIASLAGAVDFAPSVINPGAASPSSRPAAVHYIPARSVPPAPESIIYDVQKGGGPAAVMGDHDNPRRWLFRPVSYDIARHPLPKLLSDLAAAQGVPAVISPALSGEVTGKFAFANPNEFLDILCQIENMNWYFDGGSVYFFPNSELETRLFQLFNRKEDTLRNTLRELGLFDPRFGWRVADGNRLLMVQGPPVYLDRVGEILERQAEIAIAEGPPRKLAVFRLNHAWAATRTITTGDASTTVPGVVELLQKILSETPTPTYSPETTTPTPPGAPRMRKGTGLVAREKAEKTEAESGRKGEANPNAPFIQADTRLNAVLVWDYEENLPKHQAIIEALDQPLALVEIRAAIIDVETDRTKDLGVSWEYRDLGGRWKNDAGANLGETGLSPSITGLTGDGFQYATIYTKGLDSFMARVNALEKEGDANVLSRPSVLTQDNTMASLEHTETFYVRLEGEREVDLADVTTGLTLRVTPHVIQDGAGGIQLAVYIVNGSDTMDSTQAVDTLPRVRQSTISTQAVVFEGEALVVGGYYTEMRRVTDSGVPFLKNIPGVGALFRTRGRTNNKSERLFVLSPRLVIPGTSPIVEGTEYERSINASPADKLLKAPALPDPVPKEKKPLQKRPPSLRNQKVLN